MPLKLTEEAALELVRYNVDTALTVDEKKFLSNAGGAQMDEYPMTDQTYARLGLITDEEIDGNKEVFLSLEGAKNDSGKLRMDLIPPEAIEGLSEVLTMGAKKYAARNWEKGFDWGRSVAELKRHLTAWEKREDLDTESGLNHMKHVLCNAAFLVTFIDRGVGRDTRTWGELEAPDRIRERLDGMENILPRNAVID